MCTGTCHKILHFNWFQQSQTGLFHFNIAVECCRKMSFELSLPFYPQLCKTSQAEVNWIVKLGGGLNTHLAQTRAALKHFSFCLTVSSSGNLRYIACQEALAAGTQWHASAQMKTLTQRESNLPQQHSRARKRERRKKSCPWITAGVLPRGCVSCVRAALKSSS